MENVTKFGISLEEAAKLEASAKERGLTRSGEGFSSMPVGGGTAVYRLFNGMPKFNYFERHSKPGSDNEWHLYDLSMKVNGIDIEGNTFPNVQASLEQSAKDAILNPTNYGKTLTIETVEIPRDGKKPFRKTTALSVG